MKVYICIELILLVLLFKRKKYHLEYVTISFLLMLMAAIRSEFVGADVRVYFIEYEWNGAKSWKDASQVQNIHSRYTVNS